MKKTAKTILASLIGVAVLNSANAGLDPEKMKKKCLKNPDNYWVELNKECIPKDPCLYINDQTRKYCYADFCYDDARLREIYIREVKHAKIKSESKIQEPSFVSYVYELEDGRYLGFSHRCIINGPKGQVGLLHACHAYGYEFYASKDVGYCKGVGTKEKCSELVKLGADLEGEKNCSSNLTAEYNCYIKCE